MKLNTLCKFNYTDMPEKFHRGYPFKADKPYIYLGDILKMPGHGIFILMLSGRVYCGYHTLNFIELTLDLI